MVGLVTRQVGVVSVKMMSASSELVVWTTIVPSMMPLCCSDLQRELACVSLIFTFLVAVFVLFTNSHFSLVRGASCLWFTLVDCLLECRNCSTLNLYFLLQIINMSSLFC
jgi:hypothetical protein